LNAYTGGVWRNIAAMYDFSRDQSMVDVADPSSIPVLRALFLKIGTSRVVGDFYERQDKLTKLKGSGVASVAEIGELAYSKKLSRALSGRWSERRKVLGSDATRGEAKKLADNLFKEVTALIDTHNERTSAEHRQKGIGTTLYAATGPKSESDQIQAAIKLLEGMDSKELRAALDAEVKSRGNSINISKSESYRFRIHRLNRLDI